MTNFLPKEVEALGAVLNAVKDLDEAQRRWVFSSAMSNLGLGQANQAPLGTNVVSQAGSPQSRVPAPHASEDVTPKEFLRRKTPQSDVQRIACLAYYLSHMRNQPHFKTTDLTILNIEGAGSRMSNPSQAVSNATKQSHYLALAGGGKKQITTRGEEVVEALPDQEKVKSLEKSQPKKRKATKRAKNMSVKK